MEAKVAEILSKANADAAAQIIQAFRDLLSSTLRDFETRTTTIDSRPRPGRPKTVAAAAGARAAASAPKTAKPRKAQAVKTAKAKASARRRSFDQVARDDAKLLDFVRSHPGLRSEEIQKKLGMPKQHVASGLKTLRESRKIRMSGQKRAATYSAA